MICQITGELRTVDVDRIAVACGDVVYEILVPAFDVEALRAFKGQPVTLHTIFDLEGDATRGGLTPRLIGFLRAEDKRFFQLFITVKGIGPKRALRALAQPVQRIAEAIESRNARLLIELPEIGKRTAEQIVAELAGKLSAFALAASPGRPAVSARATFEQDALDAAVALGMALMDAERLLDRARQSAPELKDGQSLLREMFLRRGSR